MVGLDSHVKDTNDVLELFRRHTVFSLRMCRSRMALLGELSFGSHLPHALNCVEEEDCHKTAVHVRDTLA